MGTVTPFYLAQKTILYSDFSPKLMINLTPESHIMIQDEDSILDSLAEWLRRQTRMILALASCLSDLLGSPAQVQIL